MWVICDIETEQLVNPKYLWVVVVTEVETGKVHVFRNLHSSKADKEAFEEISKKISCWIGHNFIGFDKEVIEKHTNVKINNNNVIDTLVVSRLLYQGIEGGHSLEAIGNRLGFPKTYFKDFSKYSKEMEDYCIQDTLVTLKYFNSIKDYIYSKQWRDALRLEHDVAFICKELHNNGFHFDYKKATELYKEINDKVETLTVDLIKDFKPRTTLIREIYPKATKHGTISKVDFRWTDDLSLYTVGQPFSLIEYIPFNPGSPKQVVERLNECGWQPYEKTKGFIEAEKNNEVEKLEHYSKYGWKISENNLATLPKDAPESARKLVQWLTLNSRRSTLATWFKAYNEASKRIHGNFNPIGAWTQRMSHSDPNMANIPAGDNLYAKEMRSLWSVPENKYLIGVDADGIQLRVLAHYMNDKDFTEALIRGKKEDGTDAHTLNMKALGPICLSRDDAKTFIYAWLLGAGIVKVSQILKCSPIEAKEAVNSFILRYPGLKYLKEVVIPKDAKRGYFEGFDGRYVKCDSEHLMLAGYLQNGESVIMKRANVLWRQQLIDEGISFKQVNFVHDEWQTEVEKDYELALRVAKIQADSIRQVAEDLNLRCPFEGSILNQHKQIAIGYNWSETH